MNKARIADTGRREMTGAEMVVQALRDNGVKHLFGYPGGAVLPIYDELFQQDDIEHILVRHEQGAGHAAEGYARSTGKAGVMLVTSGPGATNAVTPLQDALMDSIPLVCLTGQVPTSLIGSDAFQECDTVGITRPCTKHNWLVKDVNDLSRIIHEAFQVATTGPSRPGRRRHPEGRAVRDAASTRRRQARSAASYQPDRSRATSTRSARRSTLMAAAKRPVIYSGGGVINSGPGGEPAAARAGRADRLSDHLDADGPRRLSGVAARTGSACSACTAPTRPTWRCMTATSWSASARASTTASPAGSTPSRRIRRRSTSTSTRRRSTRTCAPMSPILGDVGRVLEDMVRLWRASAKTDKKALYPWWEQIDRWRARDWLAYKPNDDVIMPQYAIQRLYEATKDRTPTSRPRSASTRCGRRSTSTSRSRTAG